YVRVVGSKDLEIQSLALLVTTLRIFPALLLHVDVAQRHQGCGVTGLFPLNLLVDFYRFLIPWRCIGESQLILVIGSQVLHAVGDGPMQPAMVLYVNLQDALVKRFSLGISL